MAEIPPPLASGPQQPLGPEGEGPLRDHAGGLPLTPAGAGFILTLSHADRFLWLDPNSNWAKCKRTASWDRQLAGSQQVGPGAQDEPQLRRVAGGTQFPWVGPPDKTHQQA